MTSQDPSLENNNDMEWRSITQRRKFLQSSSAAILATTTAASTFLPSPSHAAAPQDAGEAIRRSAAKIPGYGPTDVFFSDAVQGSWKATRQVEFPGRSEPLTLQYPFRFVQSIENNAVVADRGINQAELEKALVEAVSKSNGGNAVRPSYDWTMTNPNDLRLILADGSKKEIKVTKRATENTENTVTSSEFQRITLEESSDEKGFSVPSVSARRVLTKWKILLDENNSTTIEALEVVYNVPTGGDPMAAGSSNAQPSVLSKSRILLTR
ncbi:unnamed protein product [Cylindrotheca closterium]|uniref:DUF6816 domain-containing protein n=1 Tax=Cylindrotheca closterium TaxID=2856 RepID=A0AAD2CCY8_9STRA|nr:unnamed protein product [Cylindrotheca closterium]